MVIACLFQLSLTNLTLSQELEKLSSDELLQLALKETRENKNYTKGIALCKKGLALSPDYEDIRLLLGRLYLLTDSVDAAHTQFNEVLTVNPKSLEAWEGLVTANIKANKLQDAVKCLDQVLRYTAGDKQQVFAKKADLLTSLGEYDDALAVLDQGLASNSNDSLLNRQYIYVLATKGAYREAIEKAKIYLRAKPDDYKVKQQLNELRLKAADNQIGLIHLQSFYNNGVRNASITSLQYQKRLTKGNSIAARLNYATRQSGTGLQLELESYHRYNSKYYGYVLAGWSRDIVFPSWRFGYSIYRSFNKEWEGEIGLRFVRSEKQNLYAPTWSIGKYWDNYSLNLRGYVIKDGSKWHQTYVMNARYYLNEQRDYLSLILGTGTSPDDRSRNFDYSSFGSFISQSAGVGYQRSLGKLTTAGITGVWNRYKITDTKHMTQMDVYFSIYRNF